MLLRVNNVLYGDEVDMVRVLNPFSLSNCFLLGCCFIRNYQGSHTAS